MGLVRQYLTTSVPAYREEDELTAGQLLTMPFKKQRDWQLPNGVRPETRNESKSMPKPEK